MTGLSGMLAQARLVHWVMREYANQDAIPKAALMHFLHQEYEVGCMTWQCACANRAAMQAGI